MKHLSKILVALLLIVGVSNMQAQDKNNPWLIGVGVNAVDFFPTNEGGQGGLFSQFFEVAGNYNISPNVSHFSGYRYLGAGFSVGIQTSFNEITQIGGVDVEPDFLGQNLNYYSLEGSIKFDFSSFIRLGIFHPYAELGGGYVAIDGTGDPAIVGGLGFNLWVTKKIGIQVKSTYKNVFDGDGNIETIVPIPGAHFQHVAGLVYRFGGKDTDKDGIFDKNDACPEIAGLPEFNGCPDSDGDGIEDSQDACPNEAGPAEFNGCPDSDGDGIADRNDSCPTVAGLATLGGCPDADGDGITDKSDNCPNEAGPQANGGCPWPDRDSDGVLDKDDQCPDVQGTVANNGCPEVTDAVQKQLNDYAKTILFDTGKSSIKTESEQVLKDIINILNEYPNAKFTVEGHTDSVGSEKLNQKLSESRANSVKDFLTSNGVSSSRLNAVGYGEAKPIASNNTRSGRGQNRRVEINLVK